MRPIEVGVDVERSAGEVFDYLAEVENNTEWLSGMRSCRWITEPPLRLGSRYEQVGVFRRKEIRTSFEVTALEPGRSITISSLEGSAFPLTVTRAVAPLGPDRCRVTERVEADPTGFYRRAGRLLEYLVRRQITRDYRGLARRLST
jgi:uncharacterized membrane protein